MVAHRIALYTLPKEKVVPVHAANGKGLLWSIWLFWAGQVASQNAWI